MTAFIEQQKAINASVQLFIEDQRRFNQRTDDNIGILKGNAARRLLNDSFESILDRFELEFITRHNHNDLARMCRQSGFSAMVSVGQRQSFFRADLALEGVDANGVTWFVAGEASFTADHRHSDRAIRNSHFLTQITGQPAIALVASVQNDHFVQSLVDCGAIRWLELDPRLIEAD